MYVTTRHFALGVPLLAVVLSGCSLLVDANSFGDGNDTDAGPTDGGAPDGGATDSGATDGGADATDASTCGCPAGQEMSWAGHCVEPGTCPCPSGQVCDPFGLGCVPMNDCPPPRPHEDLQCGLYGWVPRCQCPDRQVWRPSPTGSGSGCVDCDPTREHWSDALRDCLPGTTPCDGRPWCSDGSVCGALPDGEWCLPTRCGDCAAEDQCVGGVACVPRGDSCGGPPVGCGVPVIRVSSRSGAPVEPRDLHVTANPVGKGWAMFWRDGREVFYATASASRSDDGSGCYSSTSGPLTLCSVRTLRVDADVFDARTTLRGGTYLGVGRNASPFGPSVPSIEGYKVDEIGGDLCASPYGISATELDADVRLEGLSVYAGSALSLDVVMRPSETAAALGRRYSSGSAAAIQFGQGDLQGDVASNIRFTAVATAMAGDRFLSVWSLEDPLDAREVRTLRDIASPAGVVAAVAPDDPGNDVFLWRAADGSFAVVSCSESGSCNEASVASVTAPRNSPFAAYRDRAGDTHLVRIDEAPGRMRRLVAHNLRDGATVELLTPDHVDGEITRVFALDAEAVPDPVPDPVSDWTYAWAAFVEVRRGPSFAVELWTGGARECF